MNNAPERIFAGGPSTPETGIWMDATSKRFGDYQSEYIRADLLPRWRPIAELPDEWRDGRQVFIKNMRGHVWAFEYKSVNARNWGWYNGVGWLNDDDILEFLDFGGKSMPDYDGAYALPLTGL